MVTPFSDAIISLGRNLGKAKSISDNINVKGLLGPCKGRKGGVEAPQHIIVTTLQYKTAQRATTYPPLPPPPSSHLAKTCREVNTEVTNLYPRGPSLEQAQVEVT